MSCYLAWRMRQVPQAPLPARCLTIGLLCTLFAAGFTTAIEPHFVGVQLDPGDLRCLL